MAFSRGTTGVGYVGHKRATAAVRRRGTEGVGEARLPAATGPWTPADIMSDLWAWYDPSKTANLVMTGASVDGAVDLSGNGRDLTAGDGGTLSKTGNIGGLQAIRNTGVMRSLRRAESLTAAAYFFVSSTTDDTFVSLSTGTLFELVAQAGNASVSNSGTVQTAFRVDGNLVPVPATRNTVQAALAGSHVVYSETSFTAWTSYRLFGFSVAGIWNYIGDYGEFIFLKNNPDLDTRQKIEGYLAWKWGTVSALDPAHPYKSAAPTSATPLPPPPPAPSLSDLAPVAYWRFWDGDSVSGLSEDDLVELAQGLDGPALVASGASRPSVRKLALGGRDALEFNGANVLESQSSISLPTGKWTVVLISQIAESTLKLAYEMGANSTTNAGFWLATASPSVNAFNSARSSKNAAKHWGSATSPQLIVHSCDGTHAGHTLRVNGVSQTLSDTTASDPGTDAIAQKFYLGGRSGGTFCIEGLVSEVAIFDRELTPAELAQISDYVQQHYDFGVAL